MCHLLRRSVKTAQACEIYIYPFSKKSIIPIYLHISKHNVEICVLGGIKLCR
jgi:hypothetical protein